LNWFIVHIAHHMTYFDLSNYDERITLLVVILFLNNIFSKILKVIIHLYKPNFYTSKGNRVKGRVIVKLLGNR